MEWLVVLGTAGLVLGLGAYCEIAKRLTGKPVAGLDEDLMALNDAVELETCEAIWALPERSNR